MQHNHVRHSPRRRRIERRPYSAYAVGCQLEAIGEALQEEDGRRAAEKAGLIDYFEPPFGDEGPF